MKHIPPRIIFSGDKEAAAKLKGTALKLWGSFTHEIATGHVQSNAVKRRLQNGVIMNFNYSTDAHNQRSGMIDIYVPLQGGEKDYAGFIFLPRYTAEDETNGFGTEGDIKDSIKHPGQSMRNWLRTNKNGFIDIVEDTGFTAGYQYWTNKEVTLSWETNVSPYPPGGIYWDLLLGSSRFDSAGQVYYHGKKIGHRHSGTVYAAKVGSGILCLVQNGTAFDTMYTSIDGSYYQFKTYNNLALKKAFINAKGTKLVIIAVTATASTYPTDMSEAVVEFDIVLQIGNFAEPIILVETNRIAQFGWVAVNELTSNNTVEIATGLAVGVDYSRTVTYTDTTATVVILSARPEGGGTYATDEQTIVYSQVVSQSPLIVDTWYDETDTLKTESFSNPTMAILGKYKYTVTNPYIANINMDIDCSIEYDIASGLWATVNNATGALFMRNNPYVKNTIAVNSSVNGSRSGDLIGSPIVYAATIEQSRYDAQGKLTFAAIADRTTTADFGGVNNNYPFPIWNDLVEGMPYSYNTNDVGIRPTYHLLSRIDDPTGVLSDRFKNKLYFWYENGGQKYAAFKEGKDENGDFTDHLPVKTAVLDAITAAITGSADILGVI